MKYSFHTYAQRRHLAPQADWILPLVAAAGLVGMNRKQIGGAVDLDRDMLDELLSGMVQIGMLTVAWDSGLPVYRKTQMQPR